MGADPFVFTAWTIHKDESGLSKYIHNVSIISWSSVRTRQVAVTRSGLL